MSAELDILKIMLSSGPIVKLILLGLLSASVYSWTIFFKKKAMLSDISESNAIFYSCYKSAARLTDIAAAAKKYPDSAFGIMFLKAHDELIHLLELIAPKREGLPQDQDSIRNYFSKFGTSALRRALIQAQTEINATIFENRIGLLATISSTAPFVGSFGTVWGIVRSFQGLSTGGGTLESIAPGIAEALVATAAGLAVAIPATWFYNYFTGHIQRQNDLLSAFSEEVLNTMERTILTKM